MGRIGIFKWLLLIGICLLFVSGCAPVRALVNNFFTPVPSTQPSQISPVLTSTDLPTSEIPNNSTAAPATVEPTEQIPVVCAYVWSNRELPEAAQEINQALRHAGLPEVDASASAYGEDCLDTDTNQVVRFTAMQTDLYFTVGIKETDDRQVMGNWVEKIMGVLAQFPVESLSGPNPGYIGIAFNNEAKKVNLWFPRTTAEDLIEQGVKGSALFDALENP